MREIDDARLEDQLADELFKRVEVLRRAGVVDASTDDAEVQRRIRSRSVSWRARLGDGDAAAATDEIVDVLFPSGLPSPRDEWWRTPLGSALLADPGTDAPR